MAGKTKANPKTAGSKFPDRRSKKMDITEYNLTNIVSLLENNERVKLGDIALIKDDKSHVKVIGWSNYNNLHIINKSIAKIELDEIKSIYQNLLETSTDFKKYMVDKRAIFELCYDYKTGGILICSIVDNEFIWAL